MKSCQRSRGRPLSADCRLDIPWDSDPECLSFLEQNPDGATAKDVAAALRCSLRLVRMIEHQLRSKFEHLKS
jgi:hypothetical protein